MTAATVVLSVAVGAAQEKARAMPDVRLMTLDPGHFHAALVQKEMYPGVARASTSSRRSVRISSSTSIASPRSTGAREQPTAWELEVHTSPDFFERMLRERPGNVVILSGRNRTEDRSDRRVGRGRPQRARRQALDPEVGRSAEGREAVLADADSKRLVAYDIMTERFEITSMLQRALVNDRATFGEIVQGHRGGARRSTWKACTT